jgi:hypothetical protein
LNRKTRDHDLDKTAMRHVEPGSESSLSYMVEDYLFHLVHHLKQIDPDFTAEWYIGHDKSPGKY